MAEKMIQVSGPLIWNRIPDDIQKAGSLPTFKKQLKLHIFDQYRGDPEDRSNSTNSNNNNNNNNSISNRNNNNNNNINRNINNNRTNINNHRIRTDNNQRWRQNINQPHVSRWNLES